MIAIDGARYYFPCDITRTARIQSSEVSGMLMNLKEYNDALATYYDYTIKLTIPLNKMQEYYTFFEQITAPVDSHVFTMPYNNSVIDVTAKVDSISDTYYRLVNSMQVWRNITVNIKALEPTKRA